MDSKLARQYEFVLLGATGYTGKLCAEHVTLKLPTNLKWAVSGRSSAKLSAVVEELKSFNSDRLPPEIEVCGMNLTELDSLAKKTRLIINTVGPYHLHSTPVVEACAKNGTHYLDVTGETPWVLEMIKKYHEMAKTNHAIIIPEIGLESAPSDLIAWLLTKIIREQLSVGTKEIIASSDMKATPSGGTIATILGLFSDYGLKKLSDSMKPWALSSIPGPKHEKPASLLSRIFGVRSVPGLGLLATSVAGNINEAIVQRSWSLLDDGKLYGPKFTFHEYQVVQSWAFGITVHSMMTFLPLFLVFPPLRWLLTKLATAPGEGPSRESRAKEYIEYRAIGTADQEVLKPKRAFARFRWDGGIYDLTGVFLAEAAMVILRDDGIAGRLEGGVLTPATLGQPFIDRLKGAGCTFETEMMVDE